MPEQTNHNEAHQDWESLYQSNQTGWDRGGSSPSLDYWLDENLLSPCRILIPGCGFGHEVFPLAKAGFTVTGIDIAPTPIKSLKHQLLNQKLNNASAILADIFDWKPDEPFDAIYEQTCLCALPPERWSNYADRLYELLVSNGKLYAQFMQTGNSGGPPYHCELGDMKVIFSKDKWEWTSGNVEKTTHHPKGKKELLYLLTKKPA